MVQEFPSNSQSKKSAKPEKVVEKVVQGNATLRKKPLGKRFKETFVREDATSVFKHVMTETLIPALKEMIRDAGQESLDRTLFGDSRTARRGSTAGNRYGKSTYNSGSGLHRSRESGVTERRKTRSSSDVGEFVLDTRIEADVVIERMHDLLEHYGQVTVADLYDLVGETGQFTDEKYGWTDLRGSGVRRLRAGEGYLLDLPRPEAL